MSGYSEELEWLRRAAAQGHAGSQRALAYKHLLAIPTDRETALPLMRQAAEGGDAYAQAYLSELHAGKKGSRSSGTLDEGSPQPDYAAGIAWCRKAAEQGLVGSQRELAHYYAEGRGLAADQAEAFRWYLAAAKQGDAESQYEVARRCADGNGTPCDPAAAFAWYRRAADTAPWSSPYNGAVGRCHELGLGTPVNLAEAAFWYRVALDFDRLEAVDPEQAKIARAEWERERDEAD